MTWLIRSTVYPHYYLCFGILFAAICFEGCAKGKVVFRNSFPPQTVSRAMIFTNLVTRKKGDKVEAFKDEPPVDTVLGIEIFPVIHLKTKEEIYVSLEDIK